MINWDRLQNKLTEAVIGVINGLLYDGLIKAEKDVPVRKVFSGGRQTVRFKTAAEVEKDKDLRSRMGLAPEIVANSEDIARFRAAGINPKGSAQVVVNDFRTDRVARNAATRVSQNGRVHVTQGGTSVGFARTVTHSDRANTWKKGAWRNGLWDDPGRDRELATNAETGEVYNRLRHEAGNFGLTSRGKYERTSGRANSQKIFSIFDSNTGQMQEQVGPAHLGGGLRKTLRVVSPTAASYPVIKGSLVAGDADHDYAKYQELGTRHNAAHPFLRPRLAEWKTTLPARLKRVVGGVR